MKTILFALFFLLGNNTFSQNIPIKFEINNLKNSDGSILVSVYNDLKSFDDGIPSMRKAIPKKENMKSGTFKAQFSLPAGVYGLVFMDDENNDGKMNNKLIGIPKEGYGFSNFYHSGFRKPKFSDFSFTLTDNIEIMQIRLRYM